MRGLRIYRRRLPHWRLDGATYFVTWRLHRGQEELSAEERGEVFRVIRHFDGLRFRLHALVVMDDHVHVVVTPRGGWGLGQILHSWKSFSSNQLQRQAGRIGAVWQADSHDRIVRNAAEFAQKIRYICNNPIRRWPDASDYPWLWIANAPHPSGEQVRPPCLTYSPDSPDPGPGTAARATSSPLSPCAGHGGPAYYSFTFGTVRSTTVAFTGAPSNSRS